MTLASRLTNTSQSPVECTFINMNFNENLVQAEIMSMLSEIIVIFFVAVLQDLYVNSAVFYHRKFWVQYKSTST